MLSARPIELKDANAFVESLHRHHDPVHRDKFRVAAYDGDKLVGVAQIARQVSRMLDDGRTAEVVRLCTDGTKNACSFLYARAARAAAALGYYRIITYILESESGSSLRAAGWNHVADTSGGGWSRASRPRNTTAPTCRKQRWEKTLKQEVRDA